MDRRNLKGDGIMLCLSLVPGEYLTIGEDVVVQYDRTVGERCRVVVHAPREVPVLRGKVLERTGAQRPACVFDTPRWYRRELPWDRSKAQALDAMRALLSKMDDRDDDVKALRRQLNHIFPKPPEQEREEMTEP